LRYLRSIAATVAVGVAATILAACDTAPGSDEPSVIRLADSWSTEIVFDPAAGISVHFWGAAAVYDSLFALPEGTGFAGDGIEPSVATEWVYSEGNTVLDIRLRDDVRFTDGTPLNAEAVKANLEYVSMPEAFNAASWSRVDEIILTGDLELQIRLSSPDAQFLQQLSSSPLANPTAFEDREKLTLEPAGSGPYLLDEVSNDSYYVFVRNPDYWDPDAYAYDQVEIAMLPDVTARVNALKAGQVDVAGIFSAQAPELEASGFDITTSTSVWAGLIFGDRRGEISPPIGNLKVRQAISMALDRVGFDESAGNGYGDPSNQIGVEGQGGGFYLPERADQYRYDLDAARELLAEAGYPNGFDIDIPNLPIVTDDYQPYFAQAFEDLGIRVNWITLTNDNWFNEVGKYAILPWKVYITDLSVFAEDNITNPWHNTDAVTEELIMTIASGTEDEAAASVAKINKKILDEAWIAVLTHVPIVFAFTEGVSGNANGYGLLPLRNIRPTD
jgi:peptide/nickel transport system substrate-binding protein